MKVKYQVNWLTLLLLGMIAPVALSGCRNAAMRPAVLAFTGTNFGLEVSQNVATQTPQMKLGYNRGEVAIVKDERENVLMEFGYGGAAHNLYQRLAVGKEAVKAVAASSMFTKDDTGKVSPEAAIAAKANAEALKAIKGD